MVGKVLGEVLGVVVGDVLGTRLGEVDGDVDGTVDGDVLGTEDGAALGTKISPTTLLRNSAWESLRSESLAGSPPDSLGKFHVHAPPLFNTLPIQSFAWNPSLSDHPGST